MKEIPSLFQGPMVRAILDGSKTQTRRIVKGMPSDVVMPRYYGPYTDGLASSGSAPREAIANSLGWFVPDASDLWPCNDGDRIRCPYGQPGDQLWVRETWMDMQGTGIEARDSEGKLTRYAYAADTPPGSYGDECRKEYGLKWKPSIHMPRCACRILLEIESVRVERLRDISEADALAEGIQRKNEKWFKNYLMPDCPDAGFQHATGSFWSLWESIYGAGSFDANPWVWAIKFKRVTA